ncbi:SAV_2336 N-terminal domain-related protein [Streptomyces sp. NPDC096030]|uniref:SAV_2336 N-terminal domain-related protein n=1 Tax=Streptomyces sp. NPDC096030 TaxID=3155423 RepID=UPI00332C7315
MITRVTKVLAESGVELSHEELLDALWLAGKLPQGTGTLARAVAPATAPEGPRPEGPSSPSPESGAPGGAAVEHPDTGPTDFEPAHPLIATAQPHAYEDGDATSSPAVAVRAPDTRPLGAGQLPLGRALRPLRQRLPDRRRVELDITRTVAAMADTGMPETVTRPVPARWLSLALVIDDGISMVLWQRLAAEIRTLMERSGAFRDVRVHGLHTRGGTPTLRTTPFRDSGRLLSPHTLSDPTGDTLVLVVSDGVGDAWQSGEMRHVLERWARCGPTALVQALPTRLWASTGISARRWQVTTHRRGGPTAAWHVTDPDLPPDLVRFDSVPVPVLEPTPSGVAAWAQLIASPGDTALLPLWTGGGAPAGRRPVAETRQENAAEAVLRFRDAASPEAYRLAAHLAAVSPVTPPVMRLVQSALGSSTDPGHLMEVFLGGLMHQLDADESDRLPHHRRFDFSADTRRLLLSAVSPGELMRTTTAVTERVEAAVGRAPAFPAWVGHPQGCALIDDTERSFGRLRQRLLTRLGVTAVTSAAEASAPPRRRGSAGPDERVAAKLAELSRPYAHRFSDLPPGWAPLEANDPPRLGRFQLEGRSVRGWPHMAMYLALDEVGTAVTVRAPSPLYVGDPSARDLLRTEAESLLRMGGRYAPELIEEGLSLTERPWIATACVNRHSDESSSVPAPNLRAVLDAHRGDVSEELFLRIGRGLAEAVDRAHSVGLVHGALAPRSVLVTEDDVRLIGWMTASIDGVDSPHRDAFPVSDSYLEASDAAESPTPEGDVHAVGALLLSFLSGRWGDPRTDREHASLRAASVGDQGLVDLLWSCLDAVPARRPSTAELVSAFSTASADTTGKRLRQAALARDDAAVGRARQMARLDPRTHGPELAKSLMRSSDRLASAGLSAESLTAVQEAVELYQDMAADTEGTHQVDLARALGNLAVRLVEAGRGDESLGPLAEALRIHRGLAERDVERHGPGLAMVLTNFSNHLAATGHPEQALEAIREAAAINRTQVHLVPHASQTRSLARCMTNMGNRLGVLGHHQDALLAAEEAVALYRDLTGLERADINADLAMSLNNLAVRLASLGRYQEAKEVADEGSAIAHSLADDLSKPARELRAQSRSVQAWLRGALSAESSVSGQ